MGKIRASNAIRLSIRECRFVEIGGNWDSDLYLELHMKADETHGQADDGSVSKTDEFVGFKGKYKGETWAVVMRTDGKPGADDQLLLRAQPEELL